MNIKRAFSTVIAVLMVPGLALAADTVTFDTEIEFTNNGNGTATATLICNTGVPLEQSFEISEGPGNGVNFVINEVDIDLDTECEITITNIVGYALTAIANGDPTGNSCKYEGGEIGDGLATELEIDNQCSFVLAPEPFVYTIIKEWAVIDGDIILEELPYELEGTCFNVRPDPDSLVSLDDASFDCAEVGDGSCSSPAWYADPDGSTYCVGDEDILDSSVETANGCADPTNFPIGRSTGSCLIINTVFFEGIPTLSQYGLAILAVLMLGVGYVGFRRFV